MRRERFDQRRPARSTGPPRFVGVPTRPTPGVATARATGRGRSTTPALTVQPAGYSTYWQYTTALAGSVVAAMKPAISNADNAIESFMLVSLGETLQMIPGCAVTSTQLPKVNLEFDCKADRGLFCWLDTDQGARVVA
jgi:hypothetical protein